MPVPNIPPPDPRFINPETGKIRSYREMNSLRQQIAAQAAAEASIAKRQANAEKHPHQIRAENFDLMAKQARENSDYAKERYYADAAAEARKELAATQGQQAFDADARVQSAKTNVDYFLAKGSQDFAGVDDLVFRRAAATYEARHSFETPERFLAAFNSIVDEITSTSRIHLTKAAMDAQGEALAAEVKAAQAAIAVADVNARASNLASPKDGPNE